MKNILLSNSFVFYTCHFKNQHYTDNRKGCAYHYIAYVKEGSAKLTDNTHTINIKAGDCFYIPLNCSYRSYWYGNPNITFESYGFTYFPNPDNTVYPLQKIDIPESLKQQLTSVKTNHNYSCENVGKFYVSFGQITKYMQRTYKSKNAETVSRAIRYMSNHNDYKISDVARYCNVSESGLYRMFRSVKGITPIELKHKLQIEKALHLLCSTDLSIEAIAEKCGFCSAIYFRQIFKKVTGKTPSQSRNQNIL